MIPFPTINSVLSVSFSFLTGQHLMQNTSLPLAHVHSHIGFHRSPLTAIEFSPDGTLLASASRDSSLFIFGVDSGALLATLELDANYVPTCVAWRDQSSFWLSSSDGAVTLWTLVRDASYSVCMQIRVLNYHF